MEQPGTGGGLRYITEESTPDMVNQELSHSCQVACARQLLKDAGVLVSEEDLLSRIGYLEGWGTTADATGRALDALHPRLGYSGGPVDPGSAAILFRRDPWIASLRTDRGTVHAVIVDSLQDDLVHVRDPWGVAGPGSGMGTRATLALADFMTHWDYAMNNVVIPNRIKVGGL